MTKSLRKKIFTVCAVLFFAVAGYHVVQTYQEDKEEAIFETFLLITIVGYQVLLSNLEKLPE